MHAQAVSNPVPISDAYRVMNGLFDEMFDVDLRPRPGCARVVADLLVREPGKLAELRARADGMFLRMALLAGVLGKA